VIDRLIEFLLSIAGAFIPFTVVPEYQAGVILRFGKYVKTIEPGFHWKIPFHVDEPLVDNVVTTVHRIAGLAAVTQDGVAVAFDAVVTYRISDVRKALLEVHDVRDAVVDSCAGLIGTAMVALTWEHIVDGSAAETISAACRKRGFRYGVEIQGVQLTGVAKARTLRLAGIGESPRPFISASLQV
jgi:regulator of protease activity HflC (stomatin/prohibitin superfamily)